jgi:hypothetical protein
MALYMGKMMLGGRMDEAFNIISSNYKHLGEGRYNLKHNADGILS